MTMLGGNRLAIRAGYELSATSVTNRGESLTAIGPHTSTQRSELRRLTGVQILSTGSYVPELVVTNDDLSKLGYDSDWIIQRTGIQARRRGPAGMATSDMAYEASVRCLEAAQADGTEVDLILLATMTPDVRVPASACALQQRLGLTCGAMDLNAACAGFMYALITGSQFIKAGTCRQVLVVGADMNTRIVNPADRKTFPLFGDGAGAALLEAGSGEQGLLAYTLGSEGEGADLLCIPSGGSRSPLTSQCLAHGRHYVKMDGRSVFKWAVRLLADSVQDVLGHASLTMDDMDLVVLHQANFRIIDAAADVLQIPRERMLMNLEKYGNTSAGSIPLALDEAYQAGRIRRGDKILMCGFGAGLAWGTAILQW